MQSEAPLLFFSYTTADRSRVLPYVETLEGKGYDCWIDIRRLKAGQDWDREIKKALDRAVIIILFVSDNATIRRGYYQREIKAALDKYKEKVFGDIYLIPVLLDDVEIPEQIRSIQCVRAWEGNAHEAIEDAIVYQLRSIGAHIQKVQEQSKIKWSRISFKDVWDGLPGYEIELDNIDLTSKEYPCVSEASSYFSAVMKDRATKGRLTKFQQEPNVYNFGHDRSRRLNQFYGQCQDPHIVGKILSLQCTAHYYYAGAAHPNLAFYTAAFMIDPLIRIEALSDIFSEKEAALEIVQLVVRESLFAPRPDEPERVAPDREWVEHGTSDWKSFHAFIFKERGIEVLFPPYQVDCYAVGPQFAFVDYQHIYKHILPHYASALELAPAWGDAPGWLTDNSVS